MFPPERLAEGVFSPKAQIGGVASKSLLRGLPEVKSQQKTAFWKAESLSFSVLKELAPGEASIASYGDFESDRSAVGRLRRRVFGNSSKLVPLVLTNSRKRKNQEMSRNP